MKIQLALDRFDISTAINIAEQCKNEADILEIGTSLLKEFGVESIRAFRKVFPQKTLLADMKTIDNACYEAKIAFMSGADIITVMGCGPVVTINLIAEAARAQKKMYMIDLLGTDDIRQEYLKAKFRDAIFCLHMSKDTQEQSNSAFDFGKVLWDGRLTAAAGGIDKNTIQAVSSVLKPDIFIIGSAISGAAEPQEAAEELCRLINKW